jgi:hypothetical protein
VVLEESLQVGGLDILDVPLVYIAVGYESGGDEVPQPLGSVVVVLVVVGVLDHLGLGSPASALFVALFGVRPVPRRSRSCSGEEIRAWKTVLPDADRVFLR